MQKVKIHLGCWHRILPGFINVDLCDMPHIHHKSGIDKLPFLADNSVDLIYCSHAFEYFDRQEAVNVLSEWRRVLAHGGILRLAVPNFEALLNVYQQTGDLDKVLGPIYGKMVIKTPTGNSVLYHKTTYDKQSLCNLLNDNGFENARIWDWRTTEHAEIDDHSQAYFPHMQKDTGTLISLNIEAEKK